MGYNTSFKGVLKFTRPLASIQELTLIEEFISNLEDSGFRKGDRGYHFDMHLSKDRSGIEHTGIKKTYGMEYAIPMFVEGVQSLIPDLGLEGTLQCQGEEIEDRYTLTLVDGGMKVIKLPSAVKVCRCPECDHVWEVE